MIPSIAKLKLSKIEGGRRADANMTKRIEERRDQLQQWEDFCEARGEEPGDVALAWLLHQEGITGPIIGPRTMEQLDGALRSLDIELDDEALATLDEMFPGPGGTAPEAYAW